MGGYLLNFGHSVLRYMNDPLRIWFGYKKTYRSTTPLFEPQLPRPIRRQVYRAVMSRITLV